MVKRREDILVSVCFSDLPATSESFAVVQNVADKLDERFRFREILVVVDSNTYEAYLPLVRSIFNLRLLTVQPGCGYYLKRIVVSDEAIGDVVLISRSEEISFLDPVKMIEQAAASNGAVLGTRPSTALARKGLWAPVFVLGRVTGFNVSPSGLQTIALPRTMLNKLLAHPNPELALRFLPQGPSFPITFQEAGPDISRGHNDGTFTERLQLIQKLLVHLSPLLLPIVTMSSALLTLLGLVFALYVAGAWMMVESLAVGWLTTSVMLSVTAVFLGVSIMGLSLGLQQIIARLDQGSAENFATEINRIDLFGQVADELNVDLDTQEAVLSISPQLSDMPDA